MRNRITDYFSKGSPAMQAAAQEMRQALRARLKEIANKALLALEDDAPITIKEFPSLHNDFTKTGIFVGDACVMVINRSDLN